MDLLQKIHADYPGNSTSTQRSRLLAAMQTLGSVATSEARLYLEIMNPSQRVTELRDEGHEIITTWSYEPSEAGRDPHRQARYLVKPVATTAGGAA
ncbi:MAG: helix-turn-helix domain-containing protein [Zoogloeaceae bacterium]|nr:helix-turn-helix domain-containing protein [Zoogloeaceae bacterium]